MARHCPAEVKAAVREFFEQLPVGAAHAVHRRDLEQIIPVPQPVAGPRRDRGRVIRDAIRELVLEGLDISSTSSAGYYRAGDGAELLAGGDDLKGRALALFVRRREQLNNGMHRLSRQQRFPVMRELVKIEETLRSWGVDVADEV
ncbi:MAG: hypothetical protein HYU66_00605 [Armatimonadetes bacterium]|nr:hypothetical protein [Armatimonadota bacterium]